MSNVLVKNGLVVTSHGIYRWDIKILNGIIAEVGTGLSSSGVEEVVDAAGCYVFPGVVDEHVHMREPGLEYKDDFEHGSRAAVKGGVTTVIEHPNTIPPVDSASRLISKAKALKPKAYVDYALLGVLHDGNVHEFEDILSAGAIGFKVFMGPTTGNIPPPSDHSLVEVLSKSAKTNTRIMFHAEDHALVLYFTEVAKKLGEDPALHEQARPPLAEVYSIAKIAAVAKYTGGKVHIVHVSSADALEAVLKAREVGVDITAETCPHYLVLEKSDYYKYGSLIKVNPPIRGGVHRETLLKSTARGVVDTIGSDHAPHAPEEKLRSIWDAAAGMPGVQTLFPIMLDLALRGLVPLTVLPRLLSENPAKLFKLYPWKGAIIPGSSGDLVIVDPSSEFTITEKWLEYKHKLTPFLGWRLKGRIKYVTLRGYIVVRDGELTGVKTGRWLTRGELLDEG
ncbi:MAG: dihydroorotase family protein [Desulfurococcaceae archaeon]